MDQFVEFRHRVVLTGTVTDGASGLPVAGAGVSLACTGSAFGDWLALKALGHGSRWESLVVRPDRAVTRDDGRFTFLDLPDGDYTATAEWMARGGRYGVATATATVARAAGGATPLLSIDLALSPTVITGTVQIAAAKAAMVAVRLKCGGEATFTDSAGVYVLAGVEPGHRTVRAEAAGLACVERDVTVGGRGQSVTLDFSFP